MVYECRASQHLSTHLVLNTEGSDPRLLLLLLARRSLILRPLVQPALVLRLLLLLLARRSLILRQLVRPALVRHPLLPLLVRRLLLLLLARRSQILRP